MTKKKDNPESRMGNQHSRKHDPLKPLRGLSPRVSQGTYAVLEGRAREEGIGVTTLAARILEEATK